MVIYLTYQLLTIEPLGNITHNGQADSLSYSAQSGYLGDDGYFTFRVSDPSGEFSNVSTVTIHVEGDVGDNHLVFDGNDYVDLPLIDLSSSDEMTVSVWINNNGNSTQQTVLRQQPSGGNPAWLIQYDGNNTIVGGLRTDSSYQELMYDDSSVDLTGGWNHIAMTYDEVANEHKLYLNGTLVESGSLDGSIYFDNSGYHEIGRASTQGANDYEPFYGKIDNLAFWDHTLTSTEINAIYNRGAGIELDTDSGSYSASSSLIGHYKMDDSYSDPANVTDETGNNSDGTLNGASWGIN